MKKNLIYIPFKNKKSIGGPSTFRITLKTYLDNNGFTYLKKCNYAKVIFFPISFNKRKLKKIKKNNGIIIQRLDGIYYPEKHGDKYIELNRNIREIYQNYSDLVIFQSNHSKDQCFNMFGEKDKSKYTIIYNGVNDELFYPTNKDITKKNKIIFISTGKFRNIDMIEPVVKALDLLKTKIDFELKIIGPVVNSKLEPFFTRDYITHLGTLTLNEVADVLRDSHIFLYSHLNPPCPNSVIEAISCGIPVVGFDSGSMSELLFFSKELLAFVSNDVFQKYEDFDFRKLADKIMLVVNNYEKYRHTALRHSNLYSFKETGKKYVEIFKKYLP